jgi:hypothetical protein
VDCGVFGVSLVLAGRGAGCLEILGVAMSTRDRVPAPKVVARTRGKTRKEVKKEESTSTEGWVLTKQQQAFIDLFSEDDSKKQ